VHGYGTVARRPLRGGEEFIDPCAAAEDGDADEADAAAGAVVVAHLEDAEAAFAFRIRSAGGGDRSEARAAPTFYLNEARGGASPNVEWQVVALGRPALGWRILRDVPAGEELLVAYDAGSE